MVLRTEPTEFGGLVLEVRTDPTEFGGMVLDVSDQTFCSQKE